MREMYNNGNYYQQLLKYSSEVKCPSIFQIDLDLKRTFPEEKRVMEEFYKWENKTFQALCDYLHFLEIN